MNSFTNNRIVQIDFDGSVAGSLSGDCKKLILTSTQDCYIRINQDDVSATNGFLVPDSIPVIIEATKVAKIAAIKVASAGKLTILELF